MKFNVFEGYTRSGMKRDKARSMGICDIILDSGKAQAYRKGADYGYDEILVTSIHSGSDVIVIEGLENHATVQGERWTRQAWYCKHFTGRCRDE